MTESIPKTRVADVFANVVFFVVDEIPTVDEMMSQVIHTGAVERQSNVRPSHSGALGPIELVLERMSDVTKVHDTMV